MDENEKNFPKNKFDVVKKFIRTFTIYILFTLIIFLRNNGHLLMIKFYIITLINY